MSLATRSRRFLRSANSFFMFSLKSLDSKPNLTRMSTRSYHSYPDPNEKPNITYAKANAQKTLNKQDKEFQLDNRFKLDNLFPGTPISKGISKENAPKTIVSTLDNGLTVASQEMPGLMSSFAFLVKAGRYKLIFFVFMHYNKERYSIKPTDLILFIAFALVRLKFSKEMTPTPEQFSF